MYTQRSANVFREYACKKLQQPYAAILGVHTIYRSLNMHAYHSTRGAFSPNLLPECRSFAYQDRTLADLLLYVVLLV